MQPKSTNSLFFRVPEGTTPDEALEWLTERTIELVSRPETLLGIGEYELRALEAGWRHARPLAGNRGVHR